VEAALLVEASLQEALVPIWSLRVILFARRPLIFKQSPG
jgi:hypothetical protein